MDEEKNLKPCPFCGGKAYMWSWNGGTQIQCEHWQHGKHLVAVVGKTQEEAIKLWENRILIPTSL